MSSYSDHIAPGMSAAAGEGFFPTADGNLHGIPAADLGDVFYRYAHGQLLNAEHHLCREGLQRHAGIHDARKAIRRCRAILSLRADARSNEVLGSMDRRLRRIGKGLSTLRDAEVAMLRASEQSERSVGEDSRKRWRQVRDDLLEVRDGLAHQALQSDPEFLKRCHSLRRLREHLGELDWTGIDVGSLRQSLRRSATRLLRAEARAQEHPILENRHRLRRRARHLRTQWNALESLSEQETVPLALRKQLTQALHKAKRQVPDIHALAKQVDQLGDQQDWRLLRAALRRDGRFADSASLVRELNAHLSS